MHTNEIAEWLQAAASKRRDRTTEVATVEPVFEGEDGDAFGFIMLDRDGIAYGIAIAPLDEETAEALHEIAEGRGTVISEATVETPESGAEFHGTNAADYEPPADEEPEPAEPEGDDADDDDEGEDE